jgi:hypothetical protein
MPSPPGRRPFLHPTISGRARAPPDTPIVLYHGGFMRDRGLPELVAAMQNPSLEPRTSS